MIKYYIKLLLINNNIIIKYYIQLLLINNHTYIKCNNNS